MNQVFRKLKILFGFLSGAFANWKTEVWIRDLDETYCCNGRECGCGGSRVGQVFGETK